jgi:hypothetical protein
LFEGFLRGRKLGHRHSGLDITAAVLLMVMRYRSVNVRPGLVEGPVLCLPRGTYIEKKKMSVREVEPSE